MIGLNENTPFQNKTRNAIGFQKAKVTGTEAQRHELVAAEKFLSDNGFRTFSLTEGCKNKAKPGFTYEWPSEKENLEGFVPAHVVNSQITALAMEKIYKPFIEGKGLKVEEDIDQTRETYRAHIDEYKEVLNGVLEEEQEAFELQQTYERKLKI